MPVRVSCSTARRPPPAAIPTPTSSSTTSRCRDSTRSSSGPNGVFAIVDSGSLNGVYVNSQRMHTTALRDGDEVQIGKFRLIFHAT